MAVSKRRAERAKFAPSYAGQRLDQDKIVLPGKRLKELKRALKEGQVHAQNENWEKALPLLLEVWDVLPDDLPLLTIIAHGLAQLGVREYAIKVLERALQENEPTIDILSIMLNLSLEMGMFEVAVKLGVQLVSMEPNEAKHYVNLATAYSGLQAYDQSIDMLQQVLPLFPENSDLWNVLATQVRIRDGFAAADVFFEEALRLNPNDFKVLSNYAQSFNFSLDYDRGLELSKKAIAVVPESSEPHINAAQIQFSRGEMEEAWQHYKYRYSSRRKVTQTQIYTHGLEMWDGQDLEGKNLLIASEQGIGDEVMFGNFIPFLSDRANKIAIGCDPRLVSIYKRRFPDAVVSPHVDQIKAGYRYRTFPYIQGPMQKDELHMDYAIPVASSAMFEWTDKEKIKSYDTPFLTADPDRSESFKARLDSISAKPKVGIAWRSGIVASDRNWLYATPEQMKPIFDLKDQVDFVNLQYGDCKEELEYFKTEFGVTVHHFDDVDLKADIEANLAIMEHCDAVVATCSAPGIFSMSLGRPTVLMCKAPPWFRFGHKDKVPFVKDCTYISAENGRTWEDIVEDVVDWVQVRLDLRG